MALRVLEVSVGDTLFFVGAVISSVFTLSLFESVAISVRHKYYSDSVKTHQRKKNLIYFDSSYLQKSVKKEMKPV